MRLSMRFRVVVTTWLASAALAMSTGWHEGCAASRGGSDMAGIRSGSGRVDPAGGSETIRCRAQYGVADGGTRVERRPVCASAS
jgi:hypothetical protein